VPAGPRLADLRRSLPLVVAIVPFDEVGVYPRPGTETGQLTRPTGPLQWAGEDVREGQALQSFAQLEGVAFAALGERQVGQAGVLARDGPRRLAVAGQVDRRK